LQTNLDAMYYSRTWQLLLACREALSSFSKFAALPLRILRILIDPPVIPVSASGAFASSTPILPQYLPHRRSEIRDWPPDRPLVTVGVPCYNYGQYVEEALASVLASTFQDFEILVIDDGSTDPHTLEVLTALEGRDPRLRVVHQENEGLAAARNKGAALGRGKYVISLDADDRIGPTYLEKTVWVLENHPEYAFCYSLVQMFGAEDGIWKTEPFSLEKALRYNHVPTGAVFRREAWIEAGGFRDELYGQDDWNFWITLGARGWEGCLIDEPLFYYRKHQASMWSTLQVEQRAETARRVQSLHQYLVGQGDSSAAEAFRPPQDPLVRASLDHPEPIPEGRLALPLRPHLHFGRSRPCLLFVVPWMAIGGAEQVVLQVMQGLSTEYNLAAVTTLDARQTWEAEFQHQTPWIYHLATLPILDGAAYLRDLVAAHRIAGVIISGSALAYQALPLLKQEPRLWTADIVHNTVPEGYLQTSIRMDPYLDCHFAVGGPQRDALTGRGGVAPEKIHLAPTSADASGRFNPDAYTDRLPDLRRRLGLRGGEIVLTYTGRLAIEKDVPLFIQVAGEIVRRNPQKRFKVFIAGDGPERARVEHEVRVQGLQGVVEILGFCDYVPEVLAVSRFAFLTSRFEGSSVTLLEAMAMRQVVVVSDVGNARDVIDDGTTGFIIPTRRPEDFAARVTEVLADPARETEIGRRARQTILERYGQQVMVRVYAAAIAQALA
jgi:glycosyltransferase involved in cell wall biosynthesis